jgi:trk system potassium uptake protein TrkH
LKSISILKMTPPQILLFGFLLIISIGTFLLSLPLAVQEGRSLGFLDALFTATSAACVTGLIVVDTGTHYSIFGQVVILILMQVGGLGFMTMASWFAILLRKKITLRDRLILKESMNQASMEGLVRLIRRVILYSITIEGIAALYFAIRWSFEMPVGKAIYFGIFHAVSIFNNAGFELFGDFRNMTPYVDDWGINIVSIALIFLGGIGFIVLSDLIEYPNTHKLSLHSKVVLSVSSILIVVGALVFFIFEFVNMKTFGPLSWDTKIIASFFQSANLRSGGTNTVDIASLREGTQFFMIILMFIGAAPGSTGGGIKVTTFAILIAAVVTMIRGKEDVVLFRYRLGKDSIYRATTITLIAIFILVSATMLLSTTEDHHFLMLLFEATSAFGTVGLSMGLTQDLTPIGKVIIILMMFLGRLGTLTLAYALQSTNKKELYRHPEGKITIG